MSDILVQDVLSKMIAYFGKDTKRINHSLKVYTFVRNIALFEDLQDESMMILEISAILHDIGIKEAERKYNSADGNYQEQEGPNVAMKLLQNFSLHSKALERISYLIAHHHSYSTGTGLDFQILIEADFLVNIFEDSYERSQIETIKNKYFKTRRGLMYINDMYLSE